MKSDFLSRSSLPRPDVSAEEAATLLLERYGLSGPIIELGSQQDRNFRISSDQGRFVLKLSSAAYAAPELEAQNAAFGWLAGRLCDVRLPRVVKDLEGHELGEVTLRGQALRYRLLTYLEGEPLTRRRYLAEDTVAAFGHLAGSLSRALEDFTHPGLEREIQWDMRLAEEVVRGLLPAISGADRQAFFARILDASSARLGPLKANLRIQPVHNDITDDNVVTAYARPDGVIDFGDLTHGWLVAELAVTASALLHHGDGDPFIILPAVRAFHAVRPLNDDEIAALWPLIVLRALVLVASAEHQASFDPDNDYLAGNAEHERRILDVATSVPFELMETAISEALGKPLAVPEIAAAPLLAQTDPALFRPVPLDVTSDLLDEIFDLSPATEEHLLAEEALGTGHAATRYGEYCLTRVKRLSAEAAETFALGVRLVLPDGTAVSAPFNGVLRRTESGLVLQGETLSLHLGGLETGLVEGEELEAGQPLGFVGANGRLSVQLCTVAGLVPPAFVQPQTASAWVHLCPSPRPLLGFDCDAPKPRNDDLMATRRKHFAATQKNYYTHPPQIERGRGEHMFDVEGRSFLDMVNNVSTVGHGHPRLAEAVWRQWSRLNTNSRFHYGAVATFSARLAELAPEGLDTVFLVNSGSEANDLAIRLAWAASGARNMVCLLEGYHGWTVGADAVSTSIADNPAALTTRPGWVHPVLSPNTYRGPYRGPESTAAYAGEVMKVIDAIEARGEKLGGFICEPVYGNAGGVPLPPGYLAKVYEAVRARGGICIADEVQVGYGRMGHYMWGVEQQGVVPDIITIAKGMGGGHPLGAVITTRAIADALENEGYFFSSAGGSPVSCAVGLTILDIHRDEDLYGNARRVGDHLKARLEALGQRFPLLGAVHGMGLYLGAEFVRDRVTLEPATEETMDICNRLLELGVIMQPTGDYLNVLKIKPPLCLTQESADFFVDMLERALVEFGTPRA